MAKDRSVWGIDIGQRALKALKLQSVGGQLQAVAFDIVEHASILSEPDANREELIRSALGQFLSRNSVVGSAVCISVPGQSSFTRFVKLPPVEPKKIPDIVRFEAEQQIPFAISDVIWRWQTFHDPDSPDVEVGIFAMKRTDIAEMLAHFASVEMPVDVVQMAPLALYNFMLFDEQVAGDGATLLADVGADKTDLVVSDGPRIWTRTVQIGGNNFTEALVKAFKLSFAKAEKLKRTAASSKYARQIFQAMRPVFADLVQEIQRSVGYYTSLHREARFRRLIGLGNGFRLPGLQKFLEQNLNLPVVRIDSYNKVTPGPGLNTPVFTDNVLTFAVAYGLALQGLGEASVATNLLPSQIARSRQWVKKRPWFAAAAAVIIMTLAVKAYRTYADKGSLSAGPDIAEARAIQRERASLKKYYGGLVSQGRQEAKQAEDILGFFTYRDYWPALQDLISRGIASQASHQGLLDDYVDAKTADERTKSLAEISGIRRSARKMFFIESMASQYKVNVYEQADAGMARRGAGTAKAPAAARGFEITITGRTPLSQTAATPFLSAIFRSWKDLAKTRKYPMISVADCGLVEYLDPGKMRSGRSGGADLDRPRQQAVEPDPMFPDKPLEDLANDTRFVVRLAVTIDAPAQAKASGGR